MHGEIPSGKELLAHDFALTNRGELDGRPVYHISDGSKEIVTFADQHAWHHPIEALDVNGSGEVTPLDVLLLINDLNRSGARMLVVPPHFGNDARFLDVNRDGSVSPRDVLVVINRLLERPQGGAEGEAGVASPEKAFVSTVQPPKKDSRSGQNPRAIAGTPRAELSCSQPPRCVALWPKNTTIPSRSKDDLKYPSNDETLDGLIEVLAENQFLLQSGSALDQMRL